MGIPKERTASKYSNVVALQLVATECLDSLKPYGSAVLWRESVGVSFLLTNS